MAYVALSSSQAEAILEAKRLYPKSSVRWLARRFHTSPGTVRNVLSGHAPYGDNRRPQRTYAGTAIVTIDSAA